MTSKEALERLYLGLYSTKENANYYDLVLQDIERKEQLEKENQELKEEYDELLDNKLELIVKNKQQDMFVDKLIKENEKLKNVIYIAKNIIDWKHKIYYWYEHNFITEAEYDLLKEILENDQN